MKNNDQNDSAWVSTNFATFCHKTLFKIWSYGYSHEASWWLKLIGIQEFFEGQGGPQNKSFCPKWPKGPPRVIFVHYDIVNEIFRNDPGMWLVFSDSTWRAAHAHICETSQRVAIFLWPFEVGNFDQKWHFFSAIISIFSLLGSIQVFDPYNTAE